MVKEQFEKENNILDAAISIFSEKGYYSTTIDMIAEAASIGKGTVYLYFSSKEEILAKIINRAMVGQNKETKEAFKINDAYKRLRAILEAGKVFLGDNATLASVLVTESMKALKNPEFRDRADDLYTEYLNLLIHALELGQRDGAFRNDFSPTTVGSLLISLRTGMLVELLRIGTTEISDDLIVDAMDFIFKGIGSVH